MEYLRTSRECIRNRIGECAPKNDIVAKMHSRFVVSTLKLRLRRIVINLFSGEWDGLNAIP